MNEPYSSDSESDVEIQNEMSNQCSSNECSSDAETSDREVRGQYAYNINYSSNIRMHLESLFEALRGFSGLCMVQSKGTERI